MTIRTATRLAALPIAFALLAFAAGCGDDTSAGDSTTTTSATATTTTAPPLKGSITVSAATSLTKAFDEIGDAFEVDHPDVDITFNYDASSALVTQIQSGAPADVFASADQANMDKLTSAGLVTGTPEVLARNELVIVTKPGNPARISSLADLATAGVVSLCGADVPCGKYAKQALDGAGVAIPETSVTRGQNAGATLTAVSQGDAVAGIVYVTDAEGAGDAVDTVTIPAAQNVIATYPIAALKASSTSAVASAFVAAVLAPEGQKILKEHGFLPPA